VRAVSSYLCVALMAVYMKRKKRASEYSHSMGAFRLL
jgi:hypothetical protein